MSPLTPAAVADALAAQGIAIAPGRAERIAKGLAPAIEAVGAEALALPFDLEAPGFAAALERRADA
jgi:hypothetical protein